MSDVYPPWGHEERHGSPFWTRAVTGARPRRGERETRRPLDTSYPLDGTCQSATGSSPMWWKSSMSGLFAATNCRANRAVYSLSAHHFRKGWSSRTGPTARVAAVRVIAGEKAHASPVATRVLHVEGRRPANGVERTVVAPTVREVEEVHVVELHGPEVCVRGEDRHRLSHEGHSRRVVQHPVVLQQQERLRADRREEEVQGRGLAQVLPSQNQQVEPQRLERRTIGRWRAVVEANPGDPHVRLDVAEVRSSVRRRSGSRLQDSMITVRCTAHPSLTSGPLGRATNARQD